MVKIPIRVRDMVFVRKKDGQIHNLSNKQGYDLGPAEDTAKRRILIDNQEYALFPTDLERC